MTKCIYCGKDIENFGFFCSYECSKKYYKWRKKNKKYILGLSYNGGVLVRFTGDSMCGSLIELKCVKNYKNLKKFFTFYKKKLKESKKNVAKNFFAKGVINLKNYE